MSGSQSGEKTERPTPKKERDARKKGQVARSQEVVTTVSLLSVISYLWVQWDANYSRLSGFFGEVALSYGEDFRTKAFQLLRLAFESSVSILAPILGIVLAMGVFGNYLQFGFVFSAESVTPKLEKVGFKQGFKRIFSRRQLFEVVKSVVKILFLAALLVLVSKSVFPAYLYSLECKMPCMIGVTSTALSRILLFSALAFLVVAVLDFIFQRSQHTRSLMMTKEEVKKEYKESEGDPVIKGRRRQIGQELAMSDGGSRTRKSTAVIVNPTHIAVAIDYKPDLMPLPVVVAKGCNLYANYLRTQAEEAGVPVFRNVSVARGLYTQTEVDDFVPDEMFFAIAEVLAWVSRNADRLYHGKLEHGVLDMEKGDHKGDGVV